MIEPSWSSSPEMTLTLWLRRSNGAEMRAEYDSQADAISITLFPASEGASGDEVHERAIVAIVDGRPVEVQLLYPSLGTDEPLGAAAKRYSLDVEALEAAARAALAAPNRKVEVDVGAALSRRYP